MTVRVTTCILLAMTALAGCKSKQQKSEDLNAEFQAANAKYKKDCYDPIQMITGGGAAAALHGGMTKAETEAFHNDERETAKRIASAQCKSEATYRDELGAKLFATMNKSQ